jgi:hypothetical protein
MINNIPEIRKFFSHHPDKFIFKNTTQAVEKITKQLPNLDYKQLKHYQNKTIKFQNKNISLFIKNCLE